MKLYPVTLNATVQCTWAYSTRVNALKWLKKEADLAATSTILEQKRSGFEIKMPHLAF